MFKGIIKISNYIDEVLKNSETKFYTDLDITINCNIEDVTIELNITNDTLEDKLKHVEVKPHIYSYNYLMRQFKLVICSNEFMTFDIHRVCRNNFYHYELNKINFNI